MENMETMNTVNTEAEVVVPEVITNTPASNASSTLKEYLPGVAGFVLGMAIAYGVHKYNQKKGEKGGESK